jgi:alanyl-tRNA synthetase
MDERRKLEKELADAKRKLAMGGGQGGAEEAVREIAGVKFLGKAISGVDPKDLKGLADDGKASLGSGVVALIGVSDDGKASAVVAVTPILSVASARSIWCASPPLRSAARAAAAVPDMAQAGGPDGVRRPMRRWKPWQLRWLAEAVAGREIALCVSGLGPSVSFLVSEPDGRRVR